MVASPRPGTPAASSEATRHVMQANRSKNTGPELKVRAALREAGLTGYRLHWKIPGRPDVCFPGRRVAILINGCFWHRCPFCSPSRPKTHAEFWEAKFERNRARDARVRAELVAEGWTVVVVWECRLKKARLEKTMDQIVDVVRRAGEERLPGHVVEIGSQGAWRLRRLRAGRRARRG
ncbi:MULTISPECIES: very short patch repair endonuclease [Atopobiaceae]|uniref:very short patch repair endonuclease n=1 Tax=Atopobiaceae TaxID=1643824 RepID=UPI000B58635E|nr:MULTISPECIES: very short patch repair endonuclease [Atopobiaceae]MCR8908498.1 very short patch repair endonuclease [Thermophilibacter sp. ET337]OUO33318.1 very short patch repair endonuclease [Olsenella sp. An293]